MTRIRNIDHYLNEDDDLPIKIKITHKSKNQTNDQSILLIKKKKKSKPRKPWKDF